MGWNQDVTLTVEVAFGDNPLATARTWTNITTYVRHKNPVTIRRKLGTPGALSLTLDNTDGRFDPTYAAGAYNPNVVPMVPIRVSYTKAEQVGEVGSGDTWNQVGTAKVEVGTTPLFTGFVTGWPQSWRGNTDPVVQVTAVDGYKLLNLLRTSGKIFGEGDSRRRVKDVAVDAQWPTEWIDGYAGVVQVQADPAVCVPMLSAMKRAIDAEAGWLFIQADGSLMFHPQTYRTGLSASVTFGDSGSELKYFDVKFPYDDGQIWNTVNVTRRGGTVQTSSDATSISSYGERTLPRLDTLHTTDTAAASVAAALKTRYKDPLVTGTMKYDPTGKWETLTWDMGHMFTLTRRTSAGNTIENDVYLESVMHTIAADKWRTTLGVSQYA